MRRIFLTLFVVLTACSVFAQTDSIKPKSAAVTLPLSNDHFVLQVGYLNWQGLPNTINKGSFPRSYNVYFMFDYPFQTNPHLSTALGVGIATDNMSFKKTYVGIRDNTTQITIKNVSDTSHFKKYKLATAYFEAPLELRFRSNAANDSKSFKAALGAKVGFLLNAHTKGKKFESSTGTALSDYTLKEGSKRFFNSNRISATAKVGYGHIGLFASYQLTPLFKEGVGPVIRPLTIGLNISGL